MLKQIPMNLDLNRNRTTPRVRSHTFTFHGSLGRKWKPTTHEELELEFEV